MGKVERRSAAGVLGAKKSDQFAPGASLTIGNAKGRDALVPEVKLRCAPSVILEEIFTFSRPVVTIRRAYPKKVR